MFARFLEEFYYKPFSDDTECYTDAESFESIIEAQESLDRLTTQSLKVPFAIDYMSATRSSNKDAHLGVQSMQRALNNELDSWSSRAIKLSCRDSLSDTYEYYQSLMLEARWHTCKIWINLGASATEQQRCNSSSRRIFQILTGLYGISAASPVDTRDTTGHACILHLVLMKIQDLDLRLAVLDHFRERFRFSGGISNFQMLYSTAKKAIEDDHAIVLGSDWDMGDSTQGLPSGENVTQPFMKAQYVTFWVLICLAIRDRIRAAWPC